MIGKIRFNYPKLREIYLNKNISKNYSKFITKRTYLLNRYNFKNI